MASHHTYILICDVCDVEFTSPGRERLLSKVRRAAVKLGWTHQVVPTKQGLAPSLDFCDDCTAIGGATTYVNETIQKLGDRFYARD